MGKAEATDQRQRVLLGVAACVCLTPPLLCKSLLDHKVHVELAGAASELLGVPVRIGDTRVGLTGTLELSDVRVGDSLYAKRVIAAVAPARVGDAGLAANEILIESPSASVTVHQDGSTNLDALLTRGRSAKREGDVGRESSRNQLRRLRVINGRIDMKLDGRGSAWATGVTIQVNDDSVHAVLGTSELHLERESYTLNGVFPRAAIDYERHGEGLQRFLADGGALRLSSPEGRALVQDLVIANTEADESWRVHARAGVDRPTGQIAAQLSPTLGGGSLEAELTEAPVFLMSPWLPKALVTRETMASGHLSLAYGRGIKTDAKLALRGLVVESSALAKRALELDLEVDATASLHKQDAAYQAEIDLRSVRSAELSVVGHASGQWSRGSLMPDLATLKLRMPKVGCDTALSALPSALRPSLAGLELRGTIQSEVELFLSRHEGDDTSLKVSSGLEGCQAVREPPAADTKSLLADYEHRSPDGRPHLLVKGASGFTAYEELPSFVPATFVAAEDARFFHHDGFDAHQIERSLAIDVHTGRFLRGGSTISQQLVKNLFLHRKRTLARKLQEAIITWRLEQNVSKKRILEVYLNIIELGDQDTYGITEASQRWFGVPASALSIHQTAFLAALTPEPTSMSARIREAGGLDEVSAARVATILRVMKRSKIISSSEYRKASKEELHLASSAVASRDTPH